MRDLHPRLLVFVLLAKPQPNRAEVEDALGGVYVGVLAIAKLLTL